MQIKLLHIQNFKSIKNLRIKDIENSLILVGKNNTGKTVVLDAISLAMGIYVPKKSDFNEKKQNIEISLSLEITQEDLKRLHSNGIVSSYKKYSSWEREFMQKLPSFSEGRLDFTCCVNYNGQLRYEDGHTKHNRYISKVLPKLHFIDTITFLLMLSRVKLLVCLVLTEQAKPHRSI